MSAQIISLDSRRRPIEDRSARLAFEWSLYEDVTQTIDHPPYYFVLKIMTHCRAKLREEKER